MNDACERRSTDGEESGGGEGEEEEETKGQDYEYAFGWDIAKLFSVRESG